MADKPQLITPQDFGGEARLIPSPVTAPGPYVEMGHAVRLEATSAIASATIRLRVRLLTAEGEITDNTQDMVITGTGIQTAIDVRVGRGWIIGLSVRATAGTITDGDIVASVHLVSGSGASSEYLATLASGEVTRTRALGLNAYTIQGAAAAATSLPDVQHDLLSPAAGAEISYTVPAGEIWEFYSLCFRLVTGVAVATRAVNIVMLSGTDRIARFGSASSQAASLTRDYTASPTGALWTPVTSTEFIIPISPMMLKEGDIVKTDTTSIQAADQYSLVVLSYRLYS